MEWENIALKIKLKKCFEVRWSIEKKRGQIASSALTFIAKISLTRFYGSLYYIQFASFVKEREASLNPFYIFTNISRNPHCQSPDVIKTIITLISIFINYWRCKDKSFFHRWQWNIFLIKWIFVPFLWISHFLRAFFITFLFEQSSVKDLCIKIL